MYFNDVDILLTLKCYVKTNNSDLSLFIYLLLLLLLIIMLFGRFVQNYTFFFTHHY